MVPLELATLSVLRALIIKRRVCKAALTVLKQTVMKTVMQAVMTTLTQALMTLELGEMGERSGKKL